jgi:hypothetical protein
MANIKLAKIYKIECLQTGQVYIGSTTQRYVCQRLGSHAHESRTARNNCTSHQILERNNYSVTVLETVPVEDRFERERYYIMNTPNVVNKIVPHPKDYDPVEAARVASKKYYDKNRDSQKRKKLAHYHDVVKPRNALLGKVSESMSSETLLLSSM